MPQAKELFDLEGKVDSSTALSIDHIRVVPVPLVPEIQLHLAEDAVVFWARLEAEAKARVATPFWASAWVGGQGLARYIMDHPTVAMGKRVLDVASGSGLAAIAAAKAGAATVIANDIDPYALAAITLNAKVNGVEITGHLGDLLSGDGGDNDLVLAGDALYNAGMAEQVLPFLRRVIARGGEVLIGDPGRGYLRAGALEVVATYQTSPVGAFSDAQFDEVHVLKLSGSTNQT